MLTFSQIFVVALTIALAGASTLAQITKPLAPPVYYFDFADRSQRVDDPRARGAYYDDVMALTALQGLANRDAPRLFVRHLAETDDFWWQEMTKPGDWLDGRDIKHARSLDELLAAFRDAYDGLVIWDERVPATSNVALSLAGVQRLLPVRYDTTPDSLFTRLTQRGLTPKVWLVGQDGSLLFTGAGNIPDTEAPSTGSAKNDAYRWLLHHHGSKLDPERISYHLDGFWLASHSAAPIVENAVPNGDYFVAHGAIRCDLHVLDDEAPIDDPGQRLGTDLETLKLILRNANARLGNGRMIQFAGFTPWAHKYSNAVSQGWNAGGRQAPIFSEQRLAELITSFNAYMDGDAPNLVFMANASFYMHYPVPEVVPQAAPKPTRERLIKEGILNDDGTIRPYNFYAYYTGDYDAAPWLTRMVPRLWNDPARGQVPITWAFNPNLADRFAYGMMWLRQRATPNDFFVSGDSGAGYVNPSRLQAPREHSDLPDGNERWAQHCRRYFQRWDLNVTGFIIDGTAPAMSDRGWDAYAKFSSGGVVVQGMDRPFGVHRDMPYVVMGPTLQEVNDPAFVSALLGTYFREEGYSFTVMRTILAQAPTLYKNVDDVLQKDAGKPSRLVDLPTLLWLVREYTSNPGAYPPVRSYAQADEVSVERTSSKGIAARLGGEDGKFEEVNAGPDNAAAWRLRSPYFYFDVDNGFAQSLRGAVDVEVTYLDEGTGELGLNYDSSSTPYQAASGDAKFANSGQWKTARFKLSSPKFNNRQNGGTDLRIVNGSAGGAIVRLIKIKRSGN
jgi:hypothetical protein